jgi:hypothetical protein
MFDNVPELRRRRVLTLRRGTSLRSILAPLLAAQTFAPAYSEAARSAA